MTQIEFLNKWLNEFNGGAIGTELAGGDRQAFEDDLAAVAGEAYYDGQTGVRGAYGCSEEEE